VAGPNEDEPCSISSQTEGTDPTERELRISDEVELFTRTDAPFFVTRIRPPSQTLKVDPGIFTGGRFLNSNGIRESGEKLGSQ
jgi:hypothetical protein